MLGGLDPTDGLSMPAEYAHETAREGLSEIEEWERRQETVASDTPSQFHKLQTAAAVHLALMRAAPPDAYSPDQFLEEWCQRLAAGMPSSASALCKRAAAASYYEDPFVAQHVNEMKCNFNLVLRSNNREGG